jgi:chromosome segregation protein
MIIDNRDKSAKKEELAHVSDGLAPYLVYDDIILARTIYADGTSDYTLNDAKVRLKDVQELLSFAGIGGSAHTIINQGEADKILLASPKDRREALLDALGLRVYHLRLAESSRKLEKVKIHVREVDLLRQEIKPHLEHLTRQVKKIESQEEEKNKLHKLFVAYFKQENLALKSLEEKIQLEGSSVSLETVRISLEKEKNILREKLSQPVKVSDTIVQKRAEFIANTRVAESKKAEVIKSLGRLEGEKMYLLKEISKHQEVTEVTVPLNEIKKTSTSLTNSFMSLRNSLEVSDIEKASLTLQEITLATHAFFDTYTSYDTLHTDELKDRHNELLSLITSHEHEVQKIQSEIGEYDRQLQELKIEEENSKEVRHEEEKQLLLLESKVRELASSIALRKQEEYELASRKDQYDALLQEGIVIVGRVLLGYQSEEVDTAYVHVSKQELLRQIERSKLRIEEAGVTNKEEVLREYSSTKERDEYLVKELSDIEETEKKLLELINELTLTLSDRFAYGVEEVSKVFSQFFGEVFVGGKAKLVLQKLVRTDEEGNEIKEEGIELDVTLPNKKVKEISMFSGGERALVSIALLFAMSQVTPPPFMVLDETDAPLDESNARKYGAMIKRLAMNSKLLVITHNRETMNHCDMLYGVTIGVDGGSKLLSINFKEAEKLVQ